ncbi:MAG: site-2 protease family protein [Deltaproteobacteria bacterium]|nr:MAG: site-2 protease family protein [Deltaproteobacteria bacterium]HDG96997.1 site-2 protease family protein [Desulfobacterales bacterium]
MLGSIEQWLVRVPVLLFAITIHEYAHGKAAYSLGDPTAKNAGRLTYNPLAHIDPLGAVCLFLFNFGWAKPVPVNPAYFQNRRQGIILMALSGPLSNLSAAFVVGLFIRYFLLPWQIYKQILLYLLLMNLGLGLFNLIPIPPLDGSHILENILPQRTAQKFRTLGRYGPIAIILVVLLDNYAHTGILNAVLIYPMFHLGHLFAGDNLSRLLTLPR